MKHILCMSSDSCSGLRRKDYLRIIHNSHFMEDILRECLNGSKEIKAKDISLAMMQPFMIWCNCFGPEDKKDPMGEYEKLLFEEGDRHERQCIKEMYPDAEEIEAETIEDGFRIALKGMFDGLKSITNVPLFYLSERADRPAPGRVPPHGHPAGLSRRTHPGPGLPPIPAVR